MNIRLFLKKKLSNKKMLIKQELKRRKQLQRKINREKLIQEKERLKWQKKHKRQYVKVLRKKNYKLWIRWKITNIKLPFILDFLRWVLIDIFRGKKKALWGVYIFVANPGEGKTLSMVQHIEEKRKADPTLKVYTNFNYKGQTGAIRCWQDIVRAEKNCIIAIDEAHLTFESTDYRNFPPEMLAQLSLNRKLRKQFICSTQRYERINKNFRDLANYVVLCKNHLKLDRWFTRYYFPKSNYEAQFDGKKAKAEYVKPYVATDKLYKKYDTLQLVEKLVEEIDDFEIQQNELLPKLESILQHEDNLDAKEIRNIINIKDRIIKQIEDQKKEQEKKRILERIESVNIELKKELEKVI
ncbi:zonular occludens toxin domain-containing protein [Clostridiaceae bacterium 35-E11]